MSSGSCSPIIRTIPPAIRPGAAEYDVENAVFGNDVFDGLDALEFPVSTARLNIGYLAAKEINWHLPGDRLSGLGSLSVGRQVGDLPYPVSAISTT